MKIEVMVKKGVATGEGSAPHVRLRFLVDNQFRGQVFFTPEEWEEARKTVFVDQRPSSPAEPAPKESGVHWREETN